MATYIIDDITKESIVIGIVKSSNEDTKELEVYIPKLMPMIPENQHEVTILTNLGNTNIDIDYDKEVTTASTITAMAYDMDEPVPEAESLVRLYFIDNNLNKVYWTKFNPNGTYKVIERDKYPEYFSLQIGEKLYKVNKDDTIKVNLPEKWEVILTEDKEKKTATYSLKCDDFEDKINELYDIIGNETHKEIRYDNDNNPYEVTVQAKGLLKEIEYIKEHGGGGGGGSSEPVTPVGEKKELYYGAATEISVYDSSFVTNTLMSFFAYSNNVTLNLSGGEENYYYYYVTPTSFATPRFTVNGFTGGFAKVATDLRIGDETYDIWRTDHHALGNLVLKVTE